jgi:5'-3' exonuclease
MGIPSYFAYVLKNHTRIIKKLEHVKCSRLMIDANSFIYDSINEFGSTNVYENVYTKITQLAKKLGVKWVYVAFDGVVPVAKMQQQKERRYKSWLSKQILNTNGWNTNAITPGTQFMNDLDNYLGPKFKTIGYEYSGPNEPGEGEHKIFEYLRNSKHDNIENIEKDNVVIYGLDADLIMLSLLHIKNRNLYLYRETKHFSYLSQIDEKKDYLFNMNEMAKQISYYLYGNTNNKQKAVENYCFLCFLCGNDFLPHFPSINIRNHGITYLLNLFKNKIKQKDLVLGVNIQWEILKELFKELSITENEMIIENIKWKKNMKYFPKNDEDELNYLPLKDSKEEYLIDNMNEYYTFLFPGSDKEKICDIYLKMLEWTWNYYNGVCSDYYIYYPFHLAPMFSSLVDSLESNEFNEKINNQLNKKNNCDRFPNVLTQLTYVLPFIEIDELVSNLVSENITLKIKNKYPNMMEMNHIIHYDFCKFFWESRVEFGYLNMREYNDFINEIIQK